MEIYKIIALGVVCALLVVYLKSVNSELTAVATVSSGILILILTLGYVKDFMVLFSELEGLSEVGVEAVKVVVKITGIAYLVEFSSDLIDDFGLKSISDKVVFAGKLLVLTMAFPMVKNLVGLAVDLL